MFPSLVDAVRRNTVNTNDGKLGWSREQCEIMAALQPYDLGGMFLPPGTHPECVDDKTWSDYLAEIDAEIAADHLDLTGSSDLVIEFLWSIKGNAIPIVIPTPDIFLRSAIRRGDGVYCFAFYSGEWWLEQVDGQMSIAVALRMIRDAELNVEFVARPDAETDRVNRGRALGKRPPVKYPRVISVNNLRKQYLGGARGPHQGGTHARPCEHVRILTERIIAPKGRKPYVRKAKVITINPGVRRETKVVL